MQANNKQIDGNHYKDKAIQPWDYITSNNLGYLEGNIVKYVSRWKEKGGYADLKKAQHYLEKLLEVAGMEPKKEDNGIPLYFPTGAGGITATAAHYLAEKTTLAGNYINPPNMDWNNCIMGAANGIQHGDVMANDKPTTKKYLNVKNQDNQGN